MKWFPGSLVLAVLLAANTSASAQVLVASGWVAGDEQGVAVDAFKETGVKPINIGAQKEDYLEDLAADDQYDGDKAYGGKGCGKGGHRGCGMLSGVDVFFDMELQFMRYFQEGGVTDVIGSPAQFAWDFTPRFELGVVGPGGLGLRMRYWDFENDAVSAAGNIVAVDAYYLDLEVFQSYSLGCHTSVECSAGVRYSDFTQFANDLTVPSSVTNGWQGWGGTLGIEAKRRILCGDLYVRGRLSVLVGDASITNVVPGPVVVPFFAEGNTVTQTELAIGYEVSGYVGRALLSARIGAEWQQWSNVAAADTSFGGVGNDDVLEDAGWAGLVLGFAVQI